MWKEYKENRTLLQLDKNKAVCYADFRMVLWNQKKEKERRREMKKVLLMVAGAAVLFIASVIFLETFFPVPVPTLINENELKLTAGEREWIIAREKETGDFYAVPGKWISPKHFIIVGEPIKIPDEDSE